MEEQQKQYAKSDKRRADVLKNNAYLNEEKSIETEKVKVVGESSKSLSFRKRIIAALSSIEGSNEG